MKQPQGEQEKCSHDIEKHPNWEYAEELLEIICDCDREKFIDISKVLNLSSEGRRIVKRIAKKKLIKSQSKVALAMEEVNVWANMLLSQPTKSREYLKILCFCYIWKIDYYAPTKVPQRCRGDFNRPLNK